MEGRAVVEAVVGQLDHLRDGHGRELGHQLDLDRARARGAIDSISKDRMIWGLRARRRPPSRDLVADADCPCV